MQSKDRLLFFTRFITSKAIDPAPLKTKNIILEFNRYLTSSGRSEDSNLSSKHEKADLHQGIDLQSASYLIMSPFHQNHAMIMKKVKLKRE